MNKSVMMLSSVRGAALNDSLRDAEIALDQDRNICPTCGVPYLQDVKFCRNCGNKLEIRLPQPEKKFCSAWYRLRRRAKFCYGCGSASAAAVSTSLDQSVHCRPQRRRPVLGSAALLNS